MKLCFLLIDSVGVVVVVVDDGGVVVVPAPAVSWHK